MFTGSFRPTTGTRHLHRDYNFTGSLVETAPKSLRHSCRSELTRQGISLKRLIRTSPNGTALPLMPFPACRHADGTISSSARRMSGVWPLRIPTESRVFTADCAHPTHFHCRLNRRVERETRSFQHIAGCTPHRCQRGGQRIYLRQLSPTSP